MKLNKKLIATGICAGMSLALLTGCSSKETKLDPNATIATIGDSQMTLGVANLMFRISQVQTGGYIRMLLGDDGSNLWEQDLIGNGTPYGQTVKDSAVREYERMILLEQHMGEYNVEITADEQAAITAAATQFLADNDAKTLEQMTATQETVERLLTLYTIEEKMEHAIKDSAEIEVTDEEAAQKKIRYAYFAIPAPEEAEEETEAVTEGGSEAAEEATEAVTEAETAATEEVTEAETAATEEVTEAETTAAEEEATEAASEEDADAEAEETEAETEEGFAETPERTATRDAVQGIIDEIKAGTDFEEAVKAYDEEKNVLEAHYGAENNAISQTLIDAAETLAEGEVVSAPIELENGFYVLEMVDTFDEEATAEEKEDILETRKNEYYSEMVNGWTPEDFSVDEKVWGAVKYYDDFRMPLPEIEETEAAEAVTEAAEETTETGSEAATEAVSEAVTEAATEAASETESAE